MEEITNLYTLYVLHPCEPREEVTVGSDLLEIISFCNQNDYNLWEIEKGGEVVARSATA